MTILIEEPLKEFFEETLPKLETGYPQRFHFKCNKCSNPIEVPIMVKRDDLESFKKLLAIATIYLFDKGGSEQMIEDIKLAINNRLEIQ